jgi:hypothetical protein
MNDWQSLVLELLTEFTELRKLFENTDISRSKKYANCARLDTFIDKIECEHIQLGFEILSSKREMIGRIEPDMIYYKNLKQYLAEYKFIIMRADSLKYSLK